MRYLICALFLLTACNSYRKNFDSPPGCGIPCTSVSTLEQMIVESPSGPEIFLGCVPKPVEIESGPICRCTDSLGPEKPFQRRIWIAPKEGRASYLYFEETPLCEEQ
jgi:hypothetical protein